MTCRWDIYLITGGHYWSLGLVMYTVWDFTMSTEYFNLIPT